MKSLLRDIFNKSSCAAVAATMALQAPAVLADESAAELAKKLSNPIANLTSIPIQYNHDSGLGPDEANRNITNIQPVIPIDLNEDANIISRTILPVVNYGSTMPGDRGASGLGDTMQSFFYSPKNPTAGGWIWGVGLALQLPTANKEDLGTGKWSAGPTAVLLKQHHGWTYGALVSHVDSFAGQSDRQFVDSSLLQPFLSYTTGTHTTLGINSEATYDGQTNEWTSPVNVTVAQLLKIGGRPVQFQLGYRKYVTNPDNTPEEGLRAAVTLLFPR